MAVKRSPWVDFVQGLRPGLTDMARTAGYRLAGGMTRGEADEERRNRDYNDWLDRREQERKWGKVDATNAREAKARAANKNLLELGIINPNAVSDARFNDLVGMAGPASKQYALEGLAERADRQTDAMGAEDVAKFKAEEAARMAEDARLRNISREDASDEMARGRYESAMKTASQARALNWKRDKRTGEKHDIGLENEASRRRKEDVAYDESRKAGIAEEQGVFPQTGKPLSSQISTRGAAGQAPSSMPSTKELRDIHQIAMDSSGLSDLRAASRNLMPGQEPPDTEAALEEYKRTVFEKLSGVWGQDAASKLMPRFVSAATGEGGTVGRTPEEIDRVTKEIEAAAKKKEAELAALEDEKLEPYRRAANPLGTAIDSFLGGQVEQFDKKTKSAAKGAGRIVDRAGNYIAKGMSPYLEAIGATPNVAKMRRPSELARQAR